MERVGGLMQDLMEGVRGYCGRDERRDCPDVTKRAMDEVKARRVIHPGELFLSFDEWETELGSIVDSYNASSQDGEVLQGLSPDEAFEAHWPHDNPPAKLDANCWHLLAHYVKEVPVTTNGICFRVGSRKFVYRNERTGQDRGKQVLAWFDPESPDLLGITDLNRRNPYLVERSTKVDFLAAPGDPVFEREIAKAAAHSAYPKARFHTLKARFAPTFRRNIVDVETAETAQAMRQQRDTAQAEQKQASAQLNKARQSFGRLGMLVPNRLRNGQAEAARDLEAMLRDSEDNAATPAPLQSAKKTYHLKPYGSGKCKYVEYLADRLTQFRASGKSFGQKFAGQITSHVTKKIATSQLGFDIYDESRFDDVCAYLKDKIDATILGKRNAAKGTANYHEFEDHPETTMKGAL